MDSQHRPSSKPTATAKRHWQGIGRTGWIIVGAAVVITGLLGSSIWQRFNRHSELQAAAKVATNTLPSVNVMTVRRAKPTTDLLLPGSVVSLNQTTIYARTTGYLRRWLADIGDRVQAGQLLAEIDSPDIDQQLAQAQAQLAQTQASLVQSRADLAKGRSDLQQARANLLIALQTWQRWRTLVKQGAVAQQDADTKYATYNATLASVQSAQNTVKSDEANVNAALANAGASQANVHRYEVLQSFEKVTAPYAGVITARNIDAGDLITSGTSSNTSIYTLTAYNTLDVNVNVPQQLVSSIQIGQTAQVTVRELPQRVFKGKVIRTTNSIDPNSRTLLTQLAVQNQDYALRPGMYANVSFNLKRDNPPLIAPDSALVNNAEGTQVAILTKNQTVHYEEVALGRDDGKQVEIVSGLSGNESIITNPTVDLQEGTRVKASIVKDQNQK